MSAMQKCANAPCDCTAVDGSEYCSAYCAGAAERTDVVCHCGHASCEGDVMSVQTGSEASQDA
jgi:hypothetical protein